MKWKLSIRLFRRFITLALISSLVCWERRSARPCLFHTLHNQMMRNAMRNHLNGLACVKMRQKIHGFCSSCLGETFDTKKNTKIDIFTNTKAHSANGGWMCACMCVRECVTTQSKDCVKIASEKCAERQEGEERRNRINSIVFVPLMLWMCACARSTTFKLREEKKSQRNENRGISNEGACIFWARDCCCCHRVCKAIEKLRDGGDDSDTENDYIEGNQNTSRIE